MLQREYEMIQSSVEERLHGLSQEVEERFVCGESWDDALRSACSSSPADSFSSYDESSVNCPSGTSSQCPSDMECYASVLCPIDEDQHVAHSQTANHQEISLEKYAPSQNLSSAVSTSDADTPSISLYEQIIHSNGWKSLLTLRKY